MLARRRLPFFACATLAALGGCGARTDLTADYDRDNADNASNIPFGCPAGGEPTIYVLSARDVLFGFDPTTASLTSVGRLGCATGAPNSMAISRSGEAFMGYVGGGLYRASTVDASCTATPFDVGQLRADRYGMGFAADPATGEETLYIAESFLSGPSRGLGIIDTTTYELTMVGPFDPPLHRLELTGTGDGRLYAFAVDEAGSSELVTVDEETARVRTERTFDLDADSFAFAFWGGDFYLFTSMGDAGSTVSRYVPAKGALEPVGQIDEEIVGAGVSTCAPL